MKEASIFCGGAARNSKRDKPEGGGVWPFVFLFLCALRIMRALKSQSRIDNRVVGNRGNVVIHGLVTVVCVELPRL